MRNIKMLLLQCCLSLETSTSNGVRGRKSGDSHSNSNGKQSWVSYVNRRGTQTRGKDVHGKEKLASAWYIVEVVRNQRVENLGKWRH